MTLIRNYTLPTYSVDSRTRWTPPANVPVKSTTVIVRGQREAHYSESTAVVGWVDKLKRHQSATSARIVQSKQLKLITPLRASWLWYQPNGLILNSKTDDTLQQMTLANLLFVDYPSSVTHLPLNSVRFYKACYEALNKYEGASDIAELHEVADGLTRLSKSIKDIIISLGSIKKHPFKTLKGVSRGLAGTWIGAMFGLSPLVRSSIDILDRAFELNKREMFLKVRSGAKNLETKTGSSYLVSSTQEGFLQARGTLQDTVTVKTRSKGEIRVSPRQSLAERFGVDVGSWVLAGWEVIPWSFLVDYMLPIGGTIKAMLALNTDLAWVSTTTVWETKRTNSVHIYGTTSSTIKLISTVDGFAEAKTKSLVRNAGIGSFTLPGIDFSDEPCALVNSVCLLILQQNEWVPPLLQKKRFSNAPVRNKRFFRIDAL